MFAIFFFVFNVVYWVDLVTNLSKFILTTNAPKSKTKKIIQL